MSIFYGSLQGALWIAGLWLFLRLVPRIPADVRAWLWRFALLKLAISVIPLHAVTLRLLPSDRPRVAQVVQTLERPVEPITRQSFSTSVLIARNHPAVYAPPASARSSSIDGSLSPSPSGGRPGRWSASALLSMRSEAKTLILVLWAFGFLVYAMMAAVDSFRARMALRRATRVEDADLRECLDGLAKRAGLRGVPLLLKSDQAPGPMVFGVGQPRIVLPAQAAVTEDDLKLALAHEVAHIKRMDLFWSAFACLVRAAMFFNPAAWLAERELRAAQESATDQEAVWLTGATVGAYGQMLLRAMSPTHRTRRLAGLSFFDSFHNAQRRLRAMKQFTERPTPVRGLVTGVVVALGMGFLPTYFLVPAHAAGLHEPRFVSRPSQNPASHGKPPAESKRRQDRVAVKPAAKPCPIETDTKVGPPKPAATPVSLKVAAIPSTPKQAPAVEVVEEFPDDTPPQPASDPETRDAAQGLKDDFLNRMHELLSSQDQRISDYRVGADEREREGEQRASEAAQRAREAEWRARVALLQEQVIQAHEKGGYAFCPEGQSDQDARIRANNDRQKKADAYQAVLDKRQADADAWQHGYDARTIQAIRDETQKEIATARDEYEKRLSELAADAGAPAREARIATVAQGSHYIGVDGLQVPVPAGYQMASFEKTSKGTYRVVLRRTGG